MYGLFGWMTNLRVVALLLILAIQLQASLALADNNLVLSVRSMPLSIFASAVEEGVSVPIEVDKTIRDFTIDGEFNGTIETILSHLFDRYGISHTESDNGYRLWRDSDYSSHASYQFQLSDMNIVTFLTYLSQSAGYRFVADTSINTMVNGTFSGTLRDIIDALSHEYPVLFYLSEDTISVVPESSFVKEVVTLPGDRDSSQTFLMKLRTKFPPGNFINHKGNQLTIGGHPDFVEVTRLKLEVAMSNSALKMAEQKSHEQPYALGNIQDVGVTKNELNTLEPAAPEPNKLMLKTPKLKNTERQKPQNSAASQSVAAQDKKIAVETATRNTRILSVEQIPGFY